MDTEKAAKKPVSIDLAPGLNCLVACILQKVTTLLIDTSVLALMLETLLN